MPKNSLFLLPLLVLFALEVQAGSIKDGQGIYQRDCLICHGMNGLASMAGAPSFKRGQGLMKPDRSLVEHLRNGKNACPSFLGILREQQMYDVVAYLRTLYP